MSLRALFLVAVCTVFLAGRVFGLHSHLSHDEHHDVVEYVHEDERAGHAEHITVPHAEGAAGHLAAHLDEGDIDLDPPATSASKASLVTGLQLAGGFDSTLVLAIPARASPVFPPPSRPPKPDSRPYLHPPSQAPPRAA